MALSSPDQMHEIFGGALAARDIDTLLDLYEPGAIQLQQDGTALQGRDVLRPVLESLFDVDMNGTATQRAPLVNGDIALTSTRYEFDSAGRTTHMVTTEVSRRQADGTWRIVIDAPYLFFG